MTDDRELSALLREAMAADARQVSASPALTQRVITLATETWEAPPVPKRRRGWQNWLLPAVAAAVVALLVSSALIGGKLLHSDRNHPASSVGPLPVTTSPRPSSAASNSPSPSRTSQPSSSPPSAPVGPVPGPVPAGFRAVELTWVNNSQGWALGTAPCASAPCTSIVRTTDGGRHWVGIPAPKAELSGTSGCSGSCLTSLRFADPMIGYAFGPSVLYLTTDGGQHWVQLPGGADALEIGNGTVLRVTGKSADCTIGAGCQFKVQRAVIGGDRWQDIPTPSGGPALVGLQLVRTGRLAVISTFGHVAGGAQSARSALFVSGDDGTHWTLRPDPCPTGGSAGETDTRAVTAASDNALAVLCTPRQAGGAQFTMTSTDNGGHFSQAPASLGSATATAFGAASGSILFASLDQLYRSTDGGAHWSRLPGGPMTASFIGFESATVGRLLEAPSNGAVGSARVWTTTDAGQTWTAYTFAR